MPVKGRFLPLVGMTKIGSFRVFTTLPKMIGKNARLKQKAVKRLPLMKDNAVISNDRSSLLKRFACHADLFV